MIQIFILGSSSVYGVGGSKGGWADLLKQALHEKMYGENGVGEKYEVYNFGKSGATISFVKDTFPKQLDQYGRGGKIIAIVSVGGNNSKAEMEPDNYVSTVDEYRQEMTELLDMLILKSNSVIAVGGGYVDEAKTNPKSNPLTGGRSYFTNSRRKKFDLVMKELCQQKGIDLIEVEKNESDWRQNYLFSDGLHFNDEGYKLISGKIIDKVMPLLNPE